MEIPSHFVEIVPAEVIPRGFQFSHKLPKRGIVFGKFIVRRFFIVYLKIQIVDRSICPIFQIPFAVFECMPFGFLTDHHDFFLAVEIMLGESEAERAGKFLLFSLLVFGF